MLKLAGKKEEKKPSHKLDPENRAMYACHTIVLLARRSGKHEATETYASVGEHKWTAACCL